MTVSRLLLGIPLSRGWIIYPLGPTGCRLRRLWPEWPLYIVCYVLAPRIPSELATTFRPIYALFVNKWYFDEIYNFLFVRPYFWLGRQLWRVGDMQIIDGFGPDGVSARVLDVTRNAVRLQSGYVYHYAFAMMMGAAAVMTWFLFGGAR